MCVCVSLLDSLPMCNAFNEFIQDKIRAQEMKKKGDMQRKANM